MNQAFMEEALALARLAAKEGEAPVGAVVVKAGRIVGRGRNRRERDKNPLGHAELEALYEASRVLGGWRLSGCELYVTLEPCPMCAGAIVNARVGSVFFGAFDPKGGYAVTLHRTFEDPALNHRPAFEGGILEEECGELLRAYFREKRRQKTKERSV